METKKPETKEKKLATGIFKDMEHNTAACMQYASLTVPAGLIGAMHEGSFFQLILIGLSFYAVFYGMGIVFTVLQNLFNPMRSKVRQFSIVMLAFVLPIPIYLVTEDPGLYAHYFFGMPR